MTELQGLVKHVQTVLVRFLPAHSPEALQSSRRVEVLLGGEALDRAESCDGLPEDLCSELPPRSVMPWLGVPRTRAAFFRRRAISDDRGFRSKSWNERGAREKASKTPLR